MTPSVLIVGAGVVGAATALRLAESGFHVTVIDKAKTIASGASGANGAQLSYSYTDALASPEMFKSLPKLLAGYDEGFRCSFDAEPGLINWATQFLRNCTRTRSDENTLSILRLALRSRSIMRHWLQLYAFDIHHRVAGKFHLYERQADLEKANTRVKMKNRLGIQQSVLRPDQLIEHEPSLEHYRADMAGAVFSPIDELGDAAVFTRLALEKAIELSKGSLNLGVECQDIIREGEYCRAVKTSEGTIQADFVIFCTGFHTPILARKLGVKLPIIPIAGYSLTYPATENSPEISITDTSKKMVICRIGERVRIAGFADIGLRNTQTPGKRLDTLRQTVQQRFPLAADYSAESSPWMGFRPMTPDSRPIVSPYGLKNTFINSGHGMLGWTLAAGTADLIKEQIMENLP